MPVTATCLCPDIPLRKKRADSIHYPRLVLLFQALVREGIRYSATNVQDMRHRWSSLGTITDDVFGCCRLWRNRVSYHLKRQSNSSTASNSNDCRCGWTMKAGHPS